MGGSTCHREKHGNALEAYSLSFPKCIPHWRLTKHSLVHFAVHNVVVVNTFWVWIHQVTYNAIVIIAMPSWTNEHFDETEKIYIEHLTKRVHGLYLAVWSICKGSKYYVSYIASNLLLVWNGAD
jgi:hypothetical protein